MKKSNFTCSSCSNNLLVTDNMITATITTDVINTPEQYQTGKVKLKVHWCETCASDLHTLTIEKKIEYTK